MARDHYDPDDRGVQYEEIDARGLKREIVVRSVDSDSTGVAIPRSQAEVVSGDFSRTSNPHNGPSRVVIRDRLNDYQPVSMDMNQIRHNPQIVRDSANYRPVQLGGQNLNQQHPFPQYPGQPPQQPYPQAAPAAYPWGGQQPPPPGTVPGQAPAGQFVWMPAETPPEAPPVYRPPVINAPDAPRPSRYVAPSQEVYFDIPNAGRFPARYDHVLVGEKSVMLVGEGFVPVVGYSPMTLTDVSSGIVVKVANVGLQHVHGGVRYLILPIIPPEDAGPPAAGA